MLNFLFEGRGLHPFLVLCVIAAGAIIPADALCSLPSALQGSWYRSSDAKIITFTNTSMQGHDLVAGSTTFTDFSCYSTSGSTYMLGLPNTVDGLTGKIYGHFCWQLVRVTDSTYLLYQLTEIAASRTFVGQRAVETLASQAVPTFNEVCTLTSSTQLPSMLYKVNTGDTEIDVANVDQTQQQCPEEVFATYSYVKDSTACSGSTSQLDFCADKKTARVDYSLCATKILFSQDGMLSCAGSVKQGNSLYVLLINHDTTVDTSTYYRFACLKVTNSGGTETATVYPGSCAATTGSHQLALTRTASCPIKEDEEDTVPIIVGSIVGGFALAAVIVALAIVYTKVYLKGKRNAVTPSKSTRNGSAMHNNTDVSQESQPGKENHTVTDNNSVPTPARLPPLEDTEKLPSLRS